MIFSYLFGPFLDLTKFSFSTWDKKLKWAIDQSSMFDMLLPLFTYLFLNSGVEPGRGTGAWPQEFWKFMFYFTLPFKDFFLIYIACRQCMQLSSTMLLSLSRNLVLGKLSFGKMLGYFKIVIFFAYYWENVINQSSKQTKIIK